MIHNHMHNHCAHAIDYCKQCDVAFCKKCGREYKAQSFTLSGWSYPSTWTSGYLQTSAIGSQQAGTGNTQGDSTTFHSHGA